LLLDSGSREAAAAPADLSSLAVSAASIAALAVFGQQIFAGEATRLAYMTDEAVEGRDAFLEKRDPDWSRFPRYF
jgi:naphthoate synthase